ncbi:MAG TPA: hypothetical protein VLV50_12880 [Stellaceae bacterium]|nr:hypothetical protein [Stellaceae bacterium]
MCVSYESSASCDGHDAKVSGSYDHNTTQVGLVNLDNVLNHDFNGNNVNILSGNGIGGLIGSGHAFA